MALDSSPEAKTAPPPTPTVRDRRALIPLPALGLQAIMLFAMPAIYWPFLDKAGEKAAFLRFILVPEALVLLLSAWAFKRMGEELRSLQIQLNEAHAREGGHQLESPFDMRTGLATRATFLDRYEYQRSLSTRYGNSFAVMIMGLDEFTELRSRWGAEAGDEVARAVGTLLAQDLRSMDLAARWGSGEFVALLPETGTEGAWTIAERLRQALESRPHPYMGQEIPITASFGICSFPDVPSLKDDLLDLADQALLRARSGGGNRIASEPG